MTDAADKKVIAVRMASCASGEGEHAVMLKLEDGQLSSDDAITLMDAGQKFVMTPPEGSPAHEAHLVTGLDLLLQTRVCECCKARVLFA